MKPSLLVFFLLAGQFLSAQTFTEVPADTSLDGVWASSIAFSDVDGDGDEDLLITGNQDGFNSFPISKLYTNTSGNFTEVVGTPFSDVDKGSVAFSDVDGDGDNDLLLTGEVPSWGGVGITRLYHNDGGNFMEAVGTSFEGSYWGSVAFSDVDGDGDEDLLITGHGNFNAPETKLYTNIGGSFIEVLNTLFAGVVGSSVTFSDVDGDGDEDLLITGQNSSSEPISTLYANDGGNFIEVIGTPFEGVSWGSVAFSDVDGDGDKDLLITGQNSSSEPIATLYANDGGNFTEELGTPFDGVLNGSVAFSDVDGDGDEDLLITGYSSSSDRIAKLYTNDGGTFTEVVNTPFEGVEDGSVAFSDVDGDGDNDLLITGLGLNGPIAKLYLNDGDASSIGELVGVDKFDVTIYPNPVTANQVNIRYHTSEQGGMLSVHLFDLLGRLLHQEQLHSVLGEQVFSIDISSLASGSYFIQLDDGKDKGTRRFLIQ